MLPVSDAAHYQNAGVRGGCAGVVLMIFLGSSRVECVARFRSGSVGGIQRTFPA
jgi:hypothetical protein